jgi:hypothetical protein
MAPRLPACRCSTSTPCSSDSARSAWCSVRERLALCSSRCARAGGRRLDCELPHGGRRRMHACHDLMRTEAVTEIPLHFCSFYLRV